MKLFSIIRYIKGNDKFLEEYKSEISFMILSVLLLLSFYIFIVITNLKRASWIFIFFFFLPFSIYALLVIYLKRVKIGKIKYFFPLIMFFAVLFQLIILTTEISLSDDVYRFFYEGKAIVNGINPYITPISDIPEVLRDQFFYKVNNTSVTSPYPPLALIFFALLYLVGKNPFIYRLTFSFGFLISIIILKRILPSNKAWKLVIYAWNPLLHIETANGSHYDSIVVLLVMLTILTINSKHTGLAGLFLVSAVMLKYYPVFIFFAYWRQLKKRGVIIFLFGIVSYIILIFFTPQSINGLIVYANDFYFNSSLLWLLIAITGSFYISKIILGITFIIILIIMAVKTSNNPLVASKIAFIILGLFLILQPSFHPWYIFWLFPFILMTDETSFSWIFLSGTLIFSYHVYILYDQVGLWKESDFIRLIEFLPFFIVFFVEIYKKYYFQLNKSNFLRKFKQKLYSE